MSNTPNENQMLSDDELLPVSAGPFWRSRDNGRPVRVAVRIIKA